LSSARSVAALLLCVAAFAGPALSPPPDPDVWWHLKAGNELLSGGPWPFKDTWSCTVPGHIWVNHEWLAEVLLASARRLGGEPGVVLFGALLAALAALLLFRASRREGLAPGPTAFLIGLGALAITDRLIPRPQIFTYVCMALFLERLAAARRDASPWVLPVIQLFWTNLHGPWVGLVSGSLLLLGGAIPQSSWSKRFQLVLLLAAASLCHPQTYRVLIEPLPRLLGGGLYRQTIQEWLPLSHPMERVIPQAPAAFLIMALGLVMAMVSVFKIPGRRSFGYPLLLALLALSPLVSNRNRDLISVALAPGFAFLFPAFRPGRRATLPFLIAALAMVVIPPAGLFKYPPAWPPRFELSRQNCPVAAAAFLNREPIGSRMFNAYDYGGYLMDTLKPKRLDFIDGRLLVGEDVYREYLETRDGGADAQAVLGRYDVDLLVIRYPQPGGYQNLAAQVRDWPDWALVFWDDETLIYVRRDRVPAEWLSSHQFRWLDPTLPPAMRNREYWIRHGEELVQEARRAADVAPTAARPVLAQALVLEYNGRLKEAAETYRRVLVTHPDNRPAREGLKRTEGG
jgi:hypothetical protein